MTTARDEILALVRLATPGAARPIPRSYRRETSRTGIVERFCERVADYRAEVHRVAGGLIADEIESVLSARNADRIVVPPGLPAAWRPPRNLIEDHGLSAIELDGLDGVVTGCEAAIAETGTIVLAGGPTDGRRALSLVPDLHVCIVREEQIVDVLPQAIARLEAVVREERRPLTFVSGPSATSDIELSRVEGVHGPRDLVVLVVA